MRTFPSSRFPSPRLVVGTVLVFGVAITLAVFRFARKEALQDFGHTFREESLTQVSRIQVYLNARLLFLDDLAHHIQLAQNLNPSDFRAFVAAERARVQGIQALEWAPMVWHRERRQAEARLEPGQGALKGFTMRDPGGALRPAPPSPTYFPVTFLEPREGNLTALGYDLGSDPARRGAIQAACDSGEPKATEPITLVQETRAQAGFLIFMPVYARNWPTQTLAQRRSAFRGVVLGVFRTADLLAAAWPGRAPLGLRGDLRDAAAASRPGPLHAWGDPEGEGARRQPAWLNRALLGPPPIQRSQVPFAGRIWIATFQPGRAFISANLQKSVWLILPLGLLITGLGAYLISLLYRQKHRAEREVLARTRDLADSHSRLASREEDLRLLLDSTAEAIYGLDMGGRCTFCNQALLTMLGYAEASQVIGQNMHQLIHHSRQDRTPFPVEECQLFRAFQQGVGTHAEHDTIWRADGSCFPVECWSFPQRRNGAVVGAVVTFIDISERVRADAEARRHQAMIQNLLDSIPDLIFFKDVEGRYLGCNPPLLELVGRGREEVVGHTDHDLFDAEGAEICRAQDQLMLAQGEALHNDEWAVYPDGRRALLDVLKTPFYGPSGELVGILGIARDITSRKAMEDGLLEKDRLLEAVSHATVGLLDASDWHLALPAFLERLGQGAKASRAYVFQKDPAVRSDAELYVNQIQEWCADGLPSLMADPERQGVAMLEAGLGRWVAQLLANLSVEGLVAELPFGEQALFAPQGAEAFLVMPVFVRGEFWGFIGFDAAEGARIWSKAEQDILRLSARALGIVIERQQDLRDLETARQDLEQRVSNRTRDLLSANMGLLSEMTTRRLAEQRLTALTRGFLQLRPEVDANLATFLGLLHELTAMDQVVYAAVEGAALRPVCAVPPLRPGLLEALPCLDPANMPRQEAVELACDRPVLAQAVWAEDQVAGVLVGWSGPGHAWSQDDRTVLGILAAAAGIEERRRRAEDENQRAQLQLHQAQKLESVGRLAAGIAHEINTPIQFLSMNLRFLEKTYDQLLGQLRGQPEAASALGWIEEETPKVLRDSMEGIDRVAGIVRAMKEFSHPGTPEPVAVDLNRNLESAATVSRNEWKYVSELRLELQPELPRIQGFPAELNQVFLNLIVNAAQAIMAKPGRDERLGLITVSTARTEEGVEIRVKDTGMGIAPEHQPKVFDPFFTTKEVGVGTGQGLSVCYQTVVNQHGGQISFETEPGEGTTFIVRLPGRAAPARPLARREGAA